MVSSRAGLSDTEVASSKGTCDITMRCAVLDRWGNTSASGVRVMIIFRARTTAAMYTLMARLVLALVPEAPFCLLNSSSPSSSSVIATVEREGISFTAAANASLVANKGSLRRCHARTPSFAPTTSSKALATENGDRESRTQRRNKSSSQKNTSALWHCFVSRR